jgi:Tol biopolymer transport system component
VDYPAGTARPITNDLAGYPNGLSVSGDGQSFVAGRIAFESDVWAGPLEDPARAKQVTFGFDDGDGASGLAWTPDGGLIYTSRAGGQSDLWLLDKPGGQARRLTTGGVGGEGVAVSGDGRFMVYVSRGAIWRRDVEGGQPKKISSGPDDQSPILSPDGRWILYWSGSGYREFRVSVEGGLPEPLGQGDEARLKRFDRFMAQSISPDGTMLAGWFASPGDDRLAVLPADGSLLRKDLLKVNTTGGEVTWSADGRSLLYCHMFLKDSGTCLWRQRLDGGAPEKVASLENAGFGRFALSPDGKQLAYSRQTATNNVVLFRQTKGE